ncbi:hypothetical protein JCM11641_005849 [Rhodosporidiobolus odoratus]
MSLPTAVRAPLFALCLALAHLSYAAPLPVIPTPLTIYSGVTAPLPTSSADVLLAPSPSPEPTTSTLTDYTTITATATATDTISVISTDVETVISTVTETVEATASSSTSASITRPHTYGTSSTTDAGPTPTPSPTAWSPSANYDNGDFSAALAVKKWAWGKDNVALVTGIPASAWATTMSSSTPAAAPTGRATNQAAVKVFPRVDLTNSTMMQVDFPKDSMNPGDKSLPTGGVGIYMTPLNLSEATNVTFSYSVFFPADFDFVKGGKLPGLYGGHEGCSGGAESEDCFSTRTMWRKDGMGELYLYAPRDDQPPALCETKPVSYCDTTYGMSIGRGAWTFQRGAWTTVRQNLKLNNPGVADGAIEIWVNDALVLSSDAVVFRKNLSKSASTTSASSTKSPSSKKPTTTPRPTHTTSKAPKATTTSSAEGLIGGLLHGLGLADVNGFNNVLLLPGDPTAASESPSTLETASPDAPTSTTSDDMPVFTPFNLHLPPVISEALDSASGAVLAPKQTATSTSTAQNAGISGMMVHSFFGGSSDSSWASPKDQKLWFDRFSLVVNA